MGDKHREVGNLEETEGIDDPRLRVRVVRVGRECVLTELNQLLTSTGREREPSRD